MRYFTKEAKKKDDGMSTGQKAAIGTGVGLAGAHALLTAKVPALGGVGKGFLKRYYEGGKFLGSLPLKAVQGKAGTALNKRVLGVDKAYKISLGPGDIFSKSIIKADRDILRATSGKSYGLSNKELLEFKTYLNRPSVANRPDKIVYPHEVGTLGYNPKFEKIRRKATQRYAGGVTMEMLAKQEAEAYKQGYSHTIGFAHFDPKQLALTGYNEVRGIEGINDAMRFFGYKRTMNKINKDLMQTGKGSLNYTRSYFRAVDPSQVRMVTKKLSKDNIGLGSRAVRKERILKSRGIPKTSPRVIKEQDFVKRYHKNIDYMYGSDFDAKFLADQATYRRRKSVYQNTAGAGAAVGVGTGAYYYGKDKG